MNVRHYFFILVTCFFASNTKGQDRITKDTHQHFVKARSVADFLIQSSIFDPELHSIYAEYTTHQKKNFRCSFLMLNNLAKAAEFIDEKEAFDCINTYLSMKQEQREMQRFYFERILNEVGFSAAMEFLGQKSNLYFGLVDDSPALISSLK